MPPVFRGRGGKTGDVLGKRGDARALLGEAVDKELIDGGKAVVAEIAGA